MPRMISREFESNAIANNNHFEISMMHANNKSAHVSIYRFSVGSDIQQNYAVID